MEKVRQVNFKCSKEDDSLIDYIMKKEKTNQGNAIKIALVKYKENFQLLNTLKILLEQQQEVIQLLKDGSVVERKEFLKEEEERKEK